MNATLRYFIPCLAAALTSTAFAQTPHQLIPTTRFIGRPVPVEMTAPVVTAVDATVDISDQLAVTTLVITVKNNLRVRRRRR